MTKTAHKILLIGAGQLGSRHLQGLSQIDIPVSIQVVDPSKASLKIARERFAEMETNQHINAISFSTGINGAEEPFDLAIIATGSDVRAQVLTSLLNSYKVNNVILEKFLFQKESDYQQVSELLLQRGVKTVVNCPRRYYPFYDQLRKTLTDKQQIIFRVAGSQWGLACNVIHFLDLFAFLTGNSSVRIDGSGLDDTILESKRPGNVEFTGTIRGENTRGDRFEISCSPDVGLPFTVTITDDTKSIEVRESERKACFFDRINGNKHEEPFTAPYQSQLTGMVARELLTNGNCILTPYPESMALHLPVLRTFLLHLNKISGQQHSCCPIT